MLHPGLNLNYFRNSLLFWKCLEARKTFTLAAVTALFFYLISPFLLQQHKCFILQSPAESIPVVVVIFSINSWIVLSMQGNQDLAEKDVHYEEVELLNNDT